MFMLGRLMKRKWMLVVTSQNGDKNESWVEGELDNYV